MTICSCRFPIILVDKRDGQDIEYISMPLEVLDSGFGDQLPEMEVVKAESLSGTVGQYMKVIWQEPHTKTRKYDVRGHIVVAGCSEDVLTCDAKNIYEVYHPIDEWIKDHTFELEGIELKDIKLKGKEL